LHDDVLEFHRAKLSEIETKGISGMIFECGVAKGGSAITFASYKHPKRCLHLFDTFDGIPQPSEKDGPDVMERYTIIQSGKEKCAMGLPDCDRSYYGNMDNLMAYDMAQFEIAGYKHSKHAVYFHKGLFDDTVWPVGPVAYVHLVCCAIFLNSSFCVVDVVILTMPSFLRRTGTGTILPIICWRGCHLTFQ
jgi:asparagine synthase (glutamine-hydrolysing)